MPAKSRSSKSDWQECDECHFLLSGARDQSRHSDICKQGKETLNSSVPDYGFIHQGIFYGIVSVSKEGEEWKLTVPDKHHVAYIHLSVMKLCHIAIGDPVVIHAGKPVVLHAWPSSSVIPPAIGLSEGAMRRLGVNKGVILPLKPLQNNSLPCQSISLQPLEYKDYMNDPTFIGLIKRDLVKKHIYQGSEFHFSYFGKPHTFTIENIQVIGSEKDTNTNNMEADISRITDNVQSLDLDRTQSDTSFSEFNTSSGLQNPSITSTPAKSDSNSASYLSQSQSHESFSSASQSFDIPVTTSVTQRSIQDLKCDIENMPVFCLVLETTSILIEDRTKNGIKEQNKVRFCDIGGLDQQIQLIQEVINLHLKQPHLLLSKGLSAPRGILLYGPSGTGKTMLARAIASETQAHCVAINAPEVFSKFYGETEAKLLSIFQEAQSRAPSIVFIDEIDVLCPKRDSVQNEVEKRVVSSLLTQLDGITTTSHDRAVILIGATSKRDHIDPALRRPGRFDKEIEIGVPTATQRTQILQKILNRVNHSLTADDIESVSQSCHGFVGADLAALCKEAGMHALRSQRPNLHSDSVDNMTLAVTLDDMTFAMQIVQPSAMREVAIEIPQVSWEDIGGQSDLKLKLKQAVEWPLKHPESFKRLGIKPPRGLLMYGPPGCSKTMIAKALARESGLNFIAIKGPELFNKWVGESERAVREVFRRARAAAPSIVFFDEIDALAVERGSGGSSVADRVLAQLLTEIDGVDALQDVTIVAATNRPDRIDKALLRPGRLDRIVYVPLPDDDTRRDIFRIQLKKTPTFTDVSVDWLVSNTHGYSGAEVCAVVHEAALFAMKEDLNIPNVAKRHFQAALKAVTPRISETMIEFYENYHKSKELQHV